MMLARQALQHISSEFTLAAIDSDSQYPCPEDGADSDLLLKRQLKLQHAGDRQQENIEITRNVDGSLSHTRWNQRGHAFRQDSVDQLFTGVWYGHCAKCDESAGIEECHKDDAKVYGIP